MNPSVNQSNNRLSSSDDYVFDTAGNTKEEPQGRTFTYDAENKQTEVRDSQQNIIGQYRYDGDGKRIKKIVPATDEVTVFVYNASGQLVAEYSTEISQTPKVSYTTADHLGSPRILTDENGATISRRDFMPFGEEIFSPQRTPSLGYTPDTIRQKFTGYERDAETDLDFAQARYSNADLGRFSSADPLMASARRAYPQTFNRYTYVLNNPLNLTDPTGMVTDCPPDCPSFQVVPADGRPPGNITTINVYASETPQERIVVTTVAPIATAITYRPLENTDITFDSENFRDVMSAAPLVIGATALAGTEEAPGVGTVIGAGIGLLGILSAATLSSVDVTTISTPTAATDQMPPPDPLVTVQHFTNQAGVQLITQSGGVLRAGTHVTLPTEIAPGASASQIEQRLEIDPGKGEYSITFQTPTSNLLPAPTGATTSGGAVQFILRGPTPINPALFVKTPR